jgi:hypothetical protein
MARSTAQKKTILSTVFGAGIQQITADCIKQFRPDWRSKNVNVHLYRVEKLFTQGVLLGLTDNPEALQELEMDSASQGILAEGAAMGLAMLDLLFPIHINRWQCFAENIGAPHIYAVHAGLGMAIARLGKPVLGKIAQLDPLHKWLVIDGFGFHLGYFEAEKYIYGRRKPRFKTDSPYAYDVFDQGLGRALWFIYSGNPLEIARAISRFEQRRQGLLWNGVGLASAHAGLFSRLAVEQMKELAGEHAIDLAEGAVIAARIRSLADSLAEHTDVACRVFSNVSALESAQLAEEALLIPGDSGCEPLYKIWRQQIRSKLKELATI